MKTIYYHFGYPLSASQVCLLIKAAGFDGTSFWWSDKYDADYRSHPDIARKAGLFVENVHAPFEKMNNIWLDNFDGDEITDKLLKCIDDCANANVPTIVMHSSFGETIPVNEIGLKRFDLLVNRAEQKNVNIALENMRKTSINLQTGQLLERYNTPHLGFCFDNGHDNARVSKEAECDMLSRFGNRLMALHLHDNNGVDDQHLLPFDGTTDWAAIMKKIGETGYTGAVSLELSIQKHENLTPEKFLAIAFERVNKLERLMQA